MEANLPHYTFVWKIEDSISTLSMIDVALVSPTFLFRDTRWCLQLRKQEGYMLQTGLWRSDNCFSHETLVYVDIKLSLIDCENASFTILILSNHAFTKGYNIVVNHSWKELLVNRRRLLPREVLTIQCELTKSYRQAPLGLSLHALDLSSDIYSLFNKKILSDCCLTSGNKKFRVHKAILWSRSRNFALRMETSEQEFISNISTSFMHSKVLSCLLRYLYSGRIGRMSTEVRAELQMVAVRYRMHDLEAKLSLQTVSSSASSRVRNDQLHFVWYISSSVLLGDGSKSDSPAIYSPKNKCSFIFRLTFDLEVINLHTRLIFVRPKEHRGEAEMKTYIFTPERSEVLDTCQVKFEKDDCAWKSMATSTDFTEYIKKKISAKCDITIAVQVFLSSRHDDCITESFQYESECPPNVFEDIQPLIRDLKRLYTKTKYSDIVLRGRRCKFKAHKAILSARSAVFARMFEDSDLKSIDLGDVEKNAINRFLFYIYSAELHCPSVDVCKHLYALGHYYEISGIGQQCSEYLKTNIWRENVCEILILANDCNDRPLKMTVHRFMYSNRDIFGSHWWKALIDERPALAGEVLMLVSVYFLIILISEIAWK